MALKRYGFFLPVKTVYPCQLMLNLSKSAPHVSAAQEESKTLYSNFSCEKPKEKNNGKLFR